ncbi:hypothetical protein PGQ11_008458 [Apiospora arundinis]|uniref:Uncharacterized protein n=1 Tax=Apiospora arundinis TaxID=335852 RepID=A0ABR2IGK9_9PEZI
MEAPAVGFLDLPREIRDEIYTLLLCNVQISKPKLGGDVHLGILRANRQIGNEANEIFRKVNRFVLFKTDLRARKTYDILRIIDSKYLSIPMMKTRNPVLLHDFNGFIMKYEISEADKSEKDRQRLEFVMLHRDLHLLCLCLQNFRETVTFAENTEHKIILPNPVKGVDTSFPTVDQQEAFLAPFSKLRGFKDVSFHGQVNLTLTDRIIRQVQIKPEELKRDAILQDLRNQDQLGDEYLQQDNLEKSCKAWAGACNKIDLLGHPSGAPYEYLSESTPWMNEVHELFFELNRKLSTGTIRIIEAKLNDEPALVPDLARLALRRINQAMFRGAFPDAIWRPSTASRADMFRQKATIFRLIKQPQKATKEIKHALALCPHDYEIRKERAAVEQMRHEFELTRTALEESTRRRPLESTRAWFGPAW